MKLKRHSSERTLIGKGVSIPRSPLSSSNCINVLGNAITNRHQMNDLSTLAEAICGSKDGIRCNTCSSPSESSTPEGNRMTQSPNTKSPCWMTMKTTGRSIVSQRVRDIRNTFKRYKKPIPFDMSRFTSATFNNKQSHKCPFGLSNSGFKDIITEFQEYGMKLRTSNEVTKEEETPTRGGIFKTPLCRSIGSNTPRRLFDSSPVSCKNSNSGHQSVPYKRRDNDYDEVDSHCLTDENVPGRGFRSKVRKIDWSPTIEENDIDSGLESMDTSRSSDCSEGLDQDLLNLSFEHCGDSGQELVNGCLKC